MSGFIVLLGKKCLNNIGIQGGINLLEWLTMIIEGFWEYKQYTIPAILTFGADLYFKWHTIIFDFIKSKLLKRGSEKSNYTLYKEGLKRQQQQILQEPFYIWGYNEYENANLLYGKGYVRKIPIKNLSNAKKRYLLVRKNRGIAILGKAGAGKSTCLRQLFLSHTNGVHQVINSICNRRYYFFRIKELIKNTENLSYLENEKKYSRGKFVFLDGLDEINDSDYKKTVQIIKRIFDYNYTIILSCRKDIYEIIKRVEPEIFTLIRYHFEIGDWTLVESNQYIEKYTKLHPNSDISNLIEPYKEKIEYKDFFKTPLELSLLIYILEQSQDLLDQESMIRNRYDLYDKFLTIWIQRELIRRNDNEIDNSLDVNMILGLWSIIAFLLIKNSNAKSIYTSNSEIKKYIQNNDKLKKYIGGIVKIDNKNERKRIIGFTHERVAEFLVAYYFCVHISKCDEYSIDALLWEYKHSVTSFIQEKFKLISHHELENDFLNLISILLNTEPYRNQTSLNKYRRPINDKLKKRIQSLSKEDMRTVKNQIIYFISRIPNIDKSLVSVGNQVVKVIYEKEKDEYNKRSAAIGATILGNNEVELRYAQELLNNPESDLRDRSFTMVYYQDVKEKNPFIYVDDEVSEWDNSRQSRLKRLSDNSEKSLRLRTFDLITIFNFTRSRINSFVPTQEELDIVRNCELNIISYSDEKRELLTKVKEDLVRLWESLM